MESRKEAHRTSETGTSSIDGSQSLRPNLSMSPKPRRPSIFHRLRSFTKGSVDPFEDIKGQEDSPQESEPSFDVACSRTNVDSLEEGDNGSESACTSGNHTLYASECLSKKCYRENHIVDGLEVIEHPSANSILNCQVRWRAPESWGYVSDLELNQGVPPPLSSFEQKGIDINCPFESAYHAPQLTAPECPMKNENLAFGFVRLVLSKCPR